MFLLFYASILWYFYASMFLFFHVSILRPCISRNGKIGFICHKIIAWKFMCIGNPFWPHEEPAGRYETQLWPPNVQYCVDRPYPPPPPHLTCLMWWESYIYVHIYWVLRNNSSVYSVVVTQSCDTLVRNQFLWLGSRRARQFLCFWTTITRLNTDIQPLFQLSQIRDR
jgi:hypothetical protein